MSTESDDNEDLEALFDSIVYAHSNEKPKESLPTSAKAEKTASSPSGARASSPSADLQEQTTDTGLHSQIGHLTRQLHDTLCELGYAKSLESAVSKMPDAHDRLNYISTLTEQAAVKTLNAVEQAKPLQEKLGNEASRLSGRWAQLFNNQLDIDSFKSLVHETHTYLQDVPSNIKATNALLMDIVMAQEFQDLTGQVIKKLAVTVQELENQLLTLLIESIPEEKRKDVDESLLHGPLIAAETHNEVAASQAQVDELLESLGF